MARVWSIGAMVIDLGVELAGWGQDKAAPGGPEFCGYRPSVPGAQWVLPDPPDLSGWSVASGGGGGVGQATITVVASSGGGAGGGGGGGSPITFPRPPHFTGTGLRVPLRDLQKQGFMINRDEFERVREHYRRRT